MNMVVSKLNLVIIASIAGAALWIEHGNHINIQPAAPATSEGQPMGACPQNESVPFSAECMAFIQGGLDAGTRPQLNAADSALADSPELPSDR
jgi:hypothetical protein